MHRKYAKKKEKKRLVNSVMTIIKKIVKTDSITRLTQLE